MRKKIFATISCLLLFLVWASTCNIWVASYEDLRVMPGLPQGIPTEPESSDPVLKEVTTEGDDAEGYNTIYVLVFGDEEERAVTRHSLTWDEYAAKQLERGDEFLVEYFGIDIRILGFENWDSDDSLNSMEDLWYELESETSQYLNQRYVGEWWTDNVDAIVGITSQVDPQPAGLAPNPSQLDDGRIFTLLNWQVHWADDNLVQHEFSHLYYAPDHYSDCCAMAYHEHFRLWIVEDSIWWVCNYVDCGYLTYHWCGSCYTLIQSNADIYVGGGCPILSVYNGTGYFEEGLLDIHNPDAKDIIEDLVLSCTPIPMEHRFLMRLTEHNRTHSYIDQVRLVAIYYGMEIQLPLVSAVHSAEGNVLWELLLSDDVRADLWGAEHNNGTSEYIDLKFVALEGLEFEDFHFIIEGHNFEFEK